MAIMDLIILDLEIDLISNNNEKYKYNSRFLILLKLYLSRKKEFVERIKAHCSFI